MSEFTFPPKPPADLVDPSGHIELPDMRTSTPIEELQNAIRIEPHTPPFRTLSPPSFATHIAAPVARVPNSITIPVSAPITVRPMESVIRKQLVTEYKSPSEYALHILFTKFVRHAESKLNMCLTYALESEPPIVEILGEGADASFDSIIASLGYIARKKPKPVIDAMMFWRKSKSEVAILAAENVEKCLRDQEMEEEVWRQQMPQGANVKRAYSTSSKSHTRNNSTKSGISDPRFQEMEDKMQQMEGKLQAAKETALQADRKSLISIYILCRVLIEIVKQAPSGNEDLGDKLEEIVFTQLKTTDPLSISSSIIKSCNWNSFAELLGYMSEKKFISVSDRFICDLERIPDHVPREREPSIHLLILGMRYLKLKHFPLELFEESSEFLVSIAKFFSKATNYSIRLAYCEVISQLLLPLAGLLTAEVNHPTWVEAISLILKTCAKLRQDSKFWASTFKLSVAALCVAPQDMFLQQWMTLLENNSKKLHKRTLDERIVFSSGLSRLVWVYMFRCQESLNNTIKTFTKLFSMFLLSSKRKENWISADLDLINPLVDLLVTVGYSHQSFVVEHVLLPTLRSVSTGMSLDSIMHERLMLALLTFKNLMLTTERPEFPTDESRQYATDLNKLTTIVSVVDVEEATKLIYTLCSILDSHVGQHMWNENEKKTSLNSPTNVSGFLAGIANPGQSGNPEFFSSRILDSDLFACVLDVIPCCLAASTYGSSVSMRNCVEVLSRNAVHMDESIANSAQMALRKMSAKQNPFALLTLYAKFSFDFDEKKSEYNVSYLSSLEYKRLLMLYVELLNSWLESFKREHISEEEGLDGITLDAKNNIFNFGTMQEPESEPNLGDEMEWKNIATVIEEVEGNGLFFLCSHDPQIRRLAISILKFIAKFDKALRDIPAAAKYAAEKGTRVIDMLQKLDFMEFVDPHSFSVAEKTRLAKLPKKDVLCCLGESDYGVDAALWQRSLPKLLYKIVERFPVTMALCRSIVCIRLVQMHQLILTYSIAKLPVARKNLVPQFVIEQWKLYLIVVCVSLTSTNDQKMHIPQHGRKRSQQIFTVQHQKITSVTSIFKMVIPLLGCDQPLLIEAIVAGLGSMNVNIYTAFVDNIDEVLISWAPINNKVRIELIRVLEKTDFPADNYVLMKIALWLRHTKIFFSNFDADTNYRLRTFFSKLLAKFFDKIQSVEHPEMYLPFEARASCFNLLLRWYEEQYMYTNNTTSSPSMELERERSHTAVLECMVALCNGKITTKLENNIIAAFDIKIMFRWIDSLLDSPENSELGKKALKSLLINNYEPTLYDEAMRRTSYFLIVSECLLVVPGHTFLELYQLLSFACVGLVHPQPDARAKSLEFLTSIEISNFGSAYTKIFQERIASKSKTVYKFTAKEISHVISELPTYEQLLLFISNFTSYYHIIPEEYQRDLLGILVPWLKKVTLKNLADLDTIMVLNNLFSITLESKHPLQLEELWSALTLQPPNIDVIIEYVILQDVSASEVVLYLGGSVIERLMDHLEQPKSMVPPTIGSIAFNPPENTKYPYVANITQQSGTLSICQLSVVFLVNLLSVPNEKVLQKLPHLLHVCIVLLDHYMPLLQDSARSILSNLLYSLCSTSKPTVSSESNNGEELLEETQKLLKQRWNYDLSLEMDSLITNIVNLLSPVYPNIEQEWQAVALNWATTCSVRHIACRSFQCFRSLVTSLDQMMLKDMLHRLSNTISDDNSDIQGFAMQILMTMNTVTVKLDSDILTEFPQLFWSVVACMSTVHEQEFITVLDSLETFLGKIDLDSLDTVHSLISTFPAKWEGKFDGLQHIVMIGLRSSLAWEKSQRVLDKLNLLEDSQIIAQNSRQRLLFAVLCMLPKMMYSFTSKDVTGCEELISLCEKHQQPSLARMVGSVMNKRFRSKNDFLSQIVGFLSREFFPEFGAQTLVFLLGLLFNKIKWVKQETMSILKVIFPAIDLKRDEFTGVGADLISPVLRLLLSSDYDQQALQVLNTVEAVSGSKMDKDVLRISMGNKDARKSYSKTATLFGIPFESGWSIPMPAVTSATTRNNVHAVFSTCGVVPESEAQQEEEEAGEELEFAFHPEGNERHSVSIEENDGSLSHMWAELDNLDSFFTTTSPPGGPENEHYKSFLAKQHSYSNSVDTTNSTESAQLLYDRKVSMLLNKSLTRTTSNASFKTSLADSFAPTQRLKSPLKANQEEGLFRFEGLMRGSRRRPPIPPTNPTVHTPQQSLQSPHKGFNRYLHSLQTDPNYLDSFKYGENVEASPSSPELTLSQSNPSPEHKNKFALPYKNKRSQQREQERQQKLMEQKRMEQQKRREEHEEGLNLEKQLFALQQQLQNY